MKILFLARALGPGGAERQMTLLAAGLQQRGHDVTVVTFYPGGNFLADVLGSGARYLSLEKSGRWDILGFLWRLRRVISHERPDILYSFLPTANIIAACLAPRIGFMRRVWGIRVSEMQLGHYGWLERLIYTVEFRLARTADLIIFNSESGRRRARVRGMALSTSVVVPNGIDTNVFMPNDVARRKIRESWGVIDGECVVGMIGRFDPMKDHRNFLTAAEVLLRSRPTLRFVLAGVGVEPGNNRLMEMLRSPKLSERVLLLGERSDMPAIMAGLDILCLSSAFGEGFPNVLGEAMAAGTPCVATNVGDSHDVVGDTGEVVPPGDPSALADAMDRLLARLAQSRDEMRNSARARIVENFSIGRLVDLTEKLLEQLIQRPFATASGDGVFPTRN